jgi:tetratricopeptide (TPR) repeat protein
LVGVSLFALLSLLAAAGVASRYQYQQAQAAGKEVERLRHLEHVKAQINDNLVAAKVHETAERWGEAGTALTTALAVLDAQQELGDEDLRADVARSLAAVQARQGARQRLEQFRPLRLDALFHETPLPGTDSRTAANPERARVAARAALAHYRLEAKNNTNPAIALLGDDRQYLTREEHAEAVEGCYELLLVWAETLSPASQTGRREDLARRTQAQQALDLLEQAGRLGKAFGLDTQTYHLRKARYRDVAQGKMADTLFPREAPAEPTGALDWFLKGLESYRKGLFDESSRACAQALRLQGKHFWARYVQALCLLRSGRWVDARAALTTCLHERPDFPWARVLRGFASSELSKTPGEFTEAQADFDAFLTDRDPLLRYVALVNRGVLFVRQQRWSDAAHDLELAAKLKPDGFQAYVNLAQAYRGAGRLREALAMLNRGIGLAPDMERLYEVRSNLRLELKDRPGARQDLEKAISLESQPGPSPRLPGLYLELGKLLQSGEENNEALRAYDRALALQPKSALAHHLRAEALLALDRRDEAGQALDRYFDLDRQPKADAYQIRGLLHAGAGRYPAAIEMYTMALRLQPNDAKIRNHRGWTYLLLESSGAALADFQTCLERAPENAEALVGRGTSVLRLAREVDCVERAVADAEAAEKHGPMSANLLYKLACLYSQARSRLEAAPRGRSARLPAQRLDLYEKQALQRLRLVAKETPLTGKARLWRQIETEPALAPLRRRPAFAALAAEYRPPAR